MDALYTNHTRSAVCAAVPHPKQPTFLPCPSTKATHATETLAGFDARAEDEQATRKTNSEGSRMGERKGGRVHVVPPCIARSRGGATVTVMKPLKSILSLPLGCVSL